jgi:hypothetical protein
MWYSRRAQSQDREPQGRGARPAAPDDPLVSCLMVTRDRLTLAKRAIRCLARQSYPLVELVIVTDGTERFGWPWNGTRPRPAWTGCAQCR